MIIGINGYIGSGKDTVGKLIQLLTMSSGTMMWYETVLDINTPQSYIDDKSIWEIKKFAAKLKQIASLLTGIPVEYFENQEFKKSYLDSNWSTTERIPGLRQDGFFGKGETYQKRMSVRELLQKLGTEAIRDGLHKNAWVNALMCDYKPEKMSQRDPSKWIVTDCRFPNEAQAIKEEGGFIIRVNRKSNVFETANGIKHESETALDTYPFDYTIENNGTIEELTLEVKKMLYSLNLMS